jgi:hypothetical protein
MAKVQIFLDDLTSMIIDCFSDLDLTTGLVGVFSINNYDRDIHLLVDDN